MTQLPDTITVQNVTVQNVTVQSVLALTRYLSNEDRRWLGALLSRLDNAPLPEQATLDEAVAFYLVQLGVDTTAVNQARYSCTSW